MGTQNPGFGYLQYYGEMGLKGKWNKAFLHFSKWNTPKVLQNFEKSSNLAKNEELALLVQLAF